LFFPIPARGEVRLLVAMVKTNAVTLLGEMTESNTLKVRTITRLCRGKFSEK
jgi:hypothetical protein